MKSVSDVDLSGPKMIRFTAKRLAMNLVFPILLLTLNPGANADPIPKELIGDWSLIIKSGEAGWLSIAEENGEPRVAMTVNVGTVHPRKGVTVKEGRIHIPLKTVRKGKDGPVL